MATKKANESLLETTLAMLKSCPRHISLKQIAIQTGLTPSWISAFAREKIPDPGVKKIQRLHDYLASLKAA